MIKVDEAASEGRRERKKRETREALASAALRLAVEKGADAVTVEEIAEAADVSVRTFFNYFPHKEHAMLGRDPEDLERALERLREAPADQSPVTTMRTLVHEVLADLEDPAGDTTQRFALVMRSPTLLSQFVLLGAEDERVLAAALAERMGESDSLRPTLIVGATSTAVRVAIEHQKKSPGRSLGALVDEAFALVAGGLDPAYRTTTMPSTHQEGQS
ncbi:TetR family transcriptional regulator [Kribbella amoyensis]|uniref:TetR family transcriptional regulator n=1 Tax=Kribbella amoyensis TaxID=996641 RepID=A0A561BLX6_9ACTN|nr:TetR family transcriptional regulator [Kribbella amoyensis]TWD79884.1 TetR family transcriptional regulator [Kribbella amoyensis]